MPTINKLKCTQTRFVMRDLEHRMPETQSRTNGNRGASLLTAASFFQHSWSLGGAERVLIFK